MKYLIVFFVCIFSFHSLSLYAQQNHFIYLQTDNKQPFYIKLNSKIYSSSSSGYLIIGKLTDGDYKLIIGFPKSEWAEQNIVVNLNNHDAGYLLKNFGEKGWGLFNIQTAEVLMAGNVAIKEDKKPQQVKDSDLFSTMLANVINDSTLLQKDIVKNETQIKTQEINKDELKQTPANVAGDTIQSKLQKDDVKIETQNKLQEVKKEEQKATFPTMIADTIQTTYQPFSVIKRTLKKKNKEGTDLIYVDEIDNKKDTIRIFIPYEKEINKDTILKKDLLVKTDSNSDNKKDIVSTADITSPKKIEINLGDDKLKNEKAINDTTQALKKDNKPQTKEYKFIEDKKDNTIIKSAMINSDCKVFANDDDFLKLRKKMAAEISDENMIKVAKKAFKSKCYSTELIKNLSTLFLKDDGKYMFFDIAYPFVSDSDLFPSLQNQLTDNYYINRFNAMVHK